MGHYVPHSQEDIEKMLGDLGLASVNDLFAMIPEALQLARPLEMRDGMSEADVVTEMERLATANTAVGGATNLTCFAGGGSYDHDIASIVRRVGMRGEWVTAYTPYQPEVSQGVLQALFEYQTLVTRLFGLPVANASLYDGATALVEAVNLCVASSGKQTVWMSAGVNPNWREVVATMAQGTGHEIVTVPVKNGRTDWSAAPAESAPGTIVVGYPNYLGVIEDLAAVKALSEQTGARIVVAADPVSLGLLKTPGSYGASVVVGEGQPFGTPMAFGGPYVGLFAVAKEETRRIPGRLVGETLDMDGLTSYVTTLRAREQDIRREKASSNVCTNQTLIAVAFLIQLSWLGTQGLREMALQGARGAKLLAEQLGGIKGVAMANSAPLVREFVITTPIEANELIHRMADEGFLAGIALSSEYDESGKSILVAVTEKRTRQEIERYAEAMEKVVR